MSRRFLVRATAIICGILMSVVLLTESQRSKLQANEEPKLPPKKTTESDNAFGPTKVWTVHLEISAKEFDAMQPVVAGPGFPGAPPPKKEQKEDEQTRDSEKNLFGTDFPWVKGDFIADGQTFKQVGVRYSGDMTYFVSSRGLKRPLKLTFDKFHDQRWLGQTSVQLHAMPLDVSKAREALAYSVFRAAGVPAPRTAFAEVTLTVPGKHDKESLGLFTIVETVDTRFAAESFGSDQGLLMKPFRVRGIDFLGDDWERYKGQYQPQREATKDEAKRVIEFAKLVNQASDQEFQKQIDSFLDVDAFLRFMAANVFTSNLESFFALGHNYVLYLDPKTGKFRFIPGDLEFSFANFLLMGSPEQLMDLSLVKPYPGANKLPDRLLAIKDVNDKYLKLLKELLTTAFAKDQLLKDVESIDTATKTVRERETKAVAARREPAPGFGGPGGTGPQPPDLKTFIEKRTASIEAQLTGMRKGYVPQQFGFGPPPSAASNSGPIDEKAFRDAIQVPPEFDATLYAVPPKVNYPVAIAAAPTGEIYVASDEQGSLGRTPGGGKILRCVDQDHDGKVDVVTVFAKVDHPRGVVYRNGSLWVMHPPTLSVFYDDNDDGIADRHEELVTGLTTDQITNRGGDHTTNCVRMGIDGWLYIGVGDYGIKEAVGKDGTKISLRGGGVVRVRPDGTELEIYCTGLRNPFDIAIDPFMNLFTRDNTNDGAGWDTRVSHLRQTALYGYTQLFANFTDEIMPTLGTFGSGGGTGGLFIQHANWPEKYRNTLFCGDWGRSEVYRYELTTHGPTFDLTQEVFMKMPRATGMDIDGSGRLYVASWRGGESAVFVGPNVGFVARVTPKGLHPEPFPDLKKSDLAQLFTLLKSPNSVARLHAQGEILQRGKQPDATKALVALASDSTALLEGRAAAVFTLKQLDGKDSHPAFLKLANDSAVREFVLRCLTDRKGEIGGLDPTTFVTALTDESPRVQAQALISLGRLNNPSLTKSIIPLTARPNNSTMPTKTPLQNQPDPDRAVPHLAVRALVALNAIDACLEALDGPHWQGALWAMRSMHEPKAVDGLIKKLGTVRSSELRRAILVTLIRLYHREADYKGSWWGIRPDNTGPFYDKTEWELSKRIGAVITAAVLDGDAETVLFLKKELTRHQVALSEVPTSTDIVKAEQGSPIMLPKADAKNPDQIGNMTYETAAKRTLNSTGDPKKGEILFKSQSCFACHTTADGQTPKGPHLVDIGKRYKADELVESILKPSQKLAQGFEPYLFQLSDGRVLNGFIVSERAGATIIREANGVQSELKRDEIEERKQQKQSAMPDGLAANLRPDQLADLIAYLQSLN